MAGMMRPNMVPPTPGYPPRQPAFQPLPTGTFMPMAAGQAMPAGQAMYAPAAGYAAQAGPRAVPGARGVGGRQQQAQLPRRIAQRPGRCPVRVLREREGLFDRHLPQ